MKQHTDWDAHDDDDVAREKRWFEYIAIESFVNKYSSWKNVNKSTFKDALLKYQIHNSLS